MKKNCVIAFSSLMLSCALYAQNKRMNVVFIMADDLGLNDTGYTGSDFFKLLISINCLKKEWCLRTHTLLRLTQLQAGPVL